MTTGFRRWIHPVVLAALSASTVAFLVAMAVPHGYCDVDESLTTDPNSSSFSCRLAEEFSATLPVLQLLPTMPAAFAGELVRPHGTPSTVLVVRATAPRAPPAP